MEENTMKAEELRIGNIVSYEATAHEIKELHSDKCLHVWNKTGADRYYSGYDEIEGFPLTPEWLFKNTVVACDGKDTEWWELSCNGWLKIKPLEGSYFFFVGKQEITEVTTVHQLQNLYFALTGQELTLKP